MTELLIATGLIAGLVAAHEIGFCVASLTHSADEPFDRQVALIRTSRALWLRSWLASHFQEQHHALSIGSISL